LRRFHESISIEFRTFSSAWLRLWDLPESFVELFFDALGFVSHVVVPECIIAHPASLKYSFSYKKVSLLVRSAAVSVIMQEKYDF
jgi:hypothetical protein